eukprot:7816458-Ditylum_brightwellii.AAC.1
MPHVTPGVDDVLDLSSLLLIESAVCNMHETVNFAVSPYNDREAKFAAIHGGKCEAVILSLAHSSESGGASSIGFSRDKRRLSVAVI